MIGEHVLGRRLRFRRSCGGRRISPLAAQYQCQLPSPLIITSLLANHEAPRGTPARNQQRRHVSSCLAKPIQSAKTVHRARGPHDCCEHHDLLKVTQKSPPPSKDMARRRARSTHTRGTRTNAQAKSAPRKRPGRRELSHIQCHRVRGRPTGRGLEGTQRPAAPYTKHQWLQLRAF